uniref:WD-40 repeat family protein n=1 Tax=Rhizophora mucronata TaxID=61149 RepID=A0A2P2LD43_RHIMU
MLFCLPNYFGAISIFFPWTMYRTAKLLRKEGYIMSSEVILDL